MARFCLIVAWGAFAAWVSWLAWQSFSHGRFPVVSRAQLLAADVAVVADVGVAPGGTPNPKVKVQQVVWPAGAANTLAGKELEIANLPGSNGFGRAGRYVLLLTGQGDGPFQMAMIPRSPLVNVPAKATVYPDSAAVLAQLREVPGPALRSGR